MVIQENETNHRLSSPTATPVVSSISSTNHIKSLCIFGKSQLLTDAKRREWMGMGVAGMIITSDYGSFPHSLRLAPVRLCIFGKSQFFSLLTSSVSRIKYHQRCPAPMVYHNGTPAALPRLESIEPINSSPLHVFPTNYDRPQAVCSGRIMYDNVDDGDGDEDDDDGDGGWGWWWWWWWWSWWWWWWGGGGGGDGMRRMMMMRRRRTMMFQILMTLL